MARSDHDDDDADDRPRKRRRRDDEEDEDDDDRPRRRRRQSSDDAGQFLVPTDVSAWSIIACYAGAIGCIVPCFALPGLICAIVALLQRKTKKKSSYGSVTSDIRAVIGLVCSGVTILGWTVILILMSLK